VEAELHILAPAAVDVDEWLASHPNCIMYSIHWAGAWVDAAEK